VSLIALPELSYAVLIVLDEKRPGKEGKFSFLLRPGGHSGESFKWCENWPYLGVFTLNGFFVLIFTEPNACHRFFPDEKGAPSVLGGLYKSQYFWNLQSGPPALPTTAEKR
jgi:hypothetical protein